MGLLIFSIDCFVGEMIVFCLTSTQLKKIQCYFSYSYFNHSANEIREKIVRRNAPSERRNTGYGTKSTFQNVAQVREVTIFVHVSVLVFLK